MTEESWKQIVGAKRYQVSDLGNVWDSDDEKFVKIHPRSNGECRKKSPKTYMQVNIKFDDGKVVTKTISVLALTTFVREPEWNECPRYLDSDVTNCVLCNLEWVVNPRKGGKVSEELAAEIKQAVANGESRNQVAKKYGLSNGYVGSLCAGFRRPNARARQRRADGTLHQGQFGYFEQKRLYAESIAK